MSSHDNHHHSMGQNDDDLQNYDPESPAAHPQLQLYGDVKVLTWNILASCYLFPNRLNYLDTTYHQFLTSRLPRFLQVIENSNADVLCLQEVDMIEHIAEGLMKLGYDVVYRQRGTYIQKTVNVPYPDLSPMSQAPKLHNNNNEQQQQLPEENQQLVEQQQQQQPEISNCIGETTTDNNNNTTTTSPNTTNDIKPQQQFKPKSNSNQVNKKNKQSFVQFNNTILYSASQTRQSSYNLYTQYLQHSYIDSTTLLANIITQTAQQYPTQITSFLPFNHEQYDINSISSLSTSTSTISSSAPLTLLKSPQESILTSSTTNSNNNMNVSLQTPIFTNSLDAFNASLANPVDFKPLFQSLEFPTFLPNPYDLTTILDFNRIDTKDTTSTQSDELLQQSESSTNDDKTNTSPDDKKSTSSNQKKSKPPIQDTSIAFPQQDPTILELRNNPLISGLLQHRPKQDGLIIAWKANKFSLSLLPLEIDLNILGYSTVYTTNNTINNNNNHNNNQQQSSSTTMNNIDVHTNTNNNLTTASNYKSQIGALSLETHIPTKLFSNFNNNSFLQQVNVNSRLLRDNIALMVALHPINQTTGLINKNKTVLIGNSYFFFSPLYEDVKIIQSVFTTRILNQFQRFILDKNNTTTNNNNNNNDNIEHDIVTIFCGDFNATPSSSAMRITFGEILSNISSIDTTHPEHDKLVAESTKDLALTPEQIKEQKDLRFLKLKQKKLMQQLKHDQDRSKSNSNDKDINVDESIQQQDEIDTINDDKNDMKDDTINTTDSNQIITESVIIPSLGKGQDASNLKLDLRLALGRAKGALIHQVAHDNFLRSLVLGGYRDSSYPIQSQEQQSQQQLQEQQLNVDTSQEQQQLIDADNTSKQQQSNEIKSDEIQNDEANILFPLVWEYYLRYLNPYTTHNNNNHNDMNNEQQQPQQQFTPTTTICTSSCPHHWSTNAISSLLQTTSLLPPCAIKTPSVLLVGDMIAFARTLRGLGVDTIQALIQPSAGFYPNSISSLDPYITQYEGPKRLKQLQLDNDNLLQQIQELMAQIDNETISDQSVKDAMNVQLESLRIQQQQIVTQIEELQRHMTTTLPTIGNIHFKMSENDKNKIPHVFQQLISYSFYSRRILVTSVASLLTYWQSLLIQTKGQHKFHDSNPYIAPAHLRHTFEPHQLPLIVYLPPVQTSFFTSKDNEEYYLQQFTTLKSYLGDKFPQQQPEQQQKHQEEVSTTTNNNDNNNNQDKSTTTTTTTTDITIYDINPIPLLPSQYSLVPSSFASRFNVSFQKKPKPSSNSALISTQLPTNAENEMNCNYTTTTTNNNMNDDIPTHQNLLDFPMKTTTSMKLNDLFSPQYNPKPIQSLYSRLLSIHTATTAISSSEQDEQSQTIKAPMGKDKAAMNTGCKSMQNDEFLDLPKPNRNNIRLCALMGILQGGIEVSSILIRCTHCNSIIPPSRRGCGKGTHCIEPQQTPDINEYTQKCEELRCLYCVEYFVGPYTHIFPSFIQSRYFNPIINPTSVLTQVQKFKSIILQTFQQNPMKWANFQLTLKDIDLFYLGKYNRQISTLHEYNHDIIPTLHNLDMSLFIPQIIENKGNNTNNNTDDQTTTQPLQYSDNRLALYIEAHHNQSEHVLPNNDTKINSTNESTSISSISTRAVLLHWLLGSLGPTALLISHIDFLSRYLSTNVSQLTFSMKNNDNNVTLKNVMKEYSKLPSFNNQNVLPIHTLSYPSRSYEPTTEGDINTNNNNDNDIINYEDGDYDGNDDDENVIKIQYQFKSDQDGNNNDTTKAPLLRLEQRKRWRREKMLKKQLEIEGLKLQGIDISQHDSLYNPSGLYDDDDDDDENNNNDDDCIECEQHCDENTSTMNNNDQSKLNIDPSKIVNKKSYFIKKEVIIESDEENIKKTKSKSNKKDDHNNEIDHDEDDDNGEDDNNNGDDDDDDGFDIYAIAPPLPTAPSKTKLYVTDGLYRLAKTLRTIGIDTGYGFPADSSKLNNTQKIQAIFDLCHAEERILVTNSRTILQRRDCPPYILLPTTLPEGLSVVQSQQIAPIQLPSLNEGGEPSYPRKSSSSSSSISSTTNAIDDNNNNNDQNTTIVPTPIKNQPVWSYKFGSQGFIKYDDETSQKVEIAYQTFLTNDKHVDYSKIWISPSAGRVYIVDFITMTQRNNKTDFQRKIIRVEPSQTINNKAIHDAITSNTNEFTHVPIRINENLEQLPPAINLADYHLYLIKTHLNFTYSPTHMYIRCTLCNGTFKPLSIHDIRQMQFLPSSIKTGRNKKDKKKLDFYMCTTCNQVYWWGSKSSSVKDRLATFLDGTSTLTITNNTNNNNLVDTNNNEQQLTDLSINTNNNNNNNQTIQSNDLIHIDDLPPTTPQIFTDTYSSTNNNNNNNNINNNYDDTKTMNDDLKIIIPPSQINEDVSKSTNNGVWQAVSRAGRVATIVLLQETPNIAPTTVPPTSATTPTTTTTRRPKVTPTYLHSVDVTYQGGSIINCLQHPLLFGLFINPKTVVQNINDIQTNETNNDNNNNITSSSTYLDMFNAKIYAKSELPFVSVFGLNRYDLHSLLQSTPLQSSQDNNILLPQPLPTIPYQYQHSLYNPIFTNAVQDYQGCLDYICVAMSSLKPKVHKTITPPTTTNQTSSLSSSVQFKWAISLTSCGNGAIHQGNNTTYQCPCIENIKYSISVFSTSIANPNTQNTPSLDSIDESLPSEQIYPATPINNNSCDDLSTLTSPTESITSPTPSECNNLTSPIDSLTSPTDSLSLTIDTTTNNTINETPITPSQRELIPSLILPHEQVHICPHALSFFFKGFNEFELFKKDIFSSTARSNNNVTSLIQSPFPSKLNPSDHCPIVASFDIGF